LFLIVINTFEFEREMFSRIIDFKFSAFKNVSSRILFIF
jgi:hypothetical protein